MPDISSPAPPAPPTQPQYGPPPAYPYPYPPQAAPGYYVQAAKVNGLAIASMVLGIVWIYWLGSILALIFGLVAKRQIAESNGTQSGSGFATAGIVLGLTGVGTLLIFGIIMIVGAVASTGSSY